MFEGGMRSDERQEESENQCKEKRKFEGRGKKEEGRRMKMGEKRVEEGKREDCQGGQSSENGK